jgi:hypothetical protein
MAQALLPKYGDSRLPAKRARKRSPIAKAGWFQ